MIILDVEQNSPEWYKAKIGKPSASKASEIVTSTGKVSGSQPRYMKDLLEELATGKKKDSYKNKRMDDGNLYEEDSANFFAFKQDVTLTKVGCVFYDEAGRFLASPDRLIEEWSAGFETKDAQFSVQYDRLKGTEKFPNPAKWCQCQMGMLCTGYDSWWIQSFCRAVDPEGVLIFPPITIQVLRDEQYISMLHSELEKFCDTLESEFMGLRQWKMR